MVDATVVEDELPIEERKKILAETALEAQMHNPLLQYYSRVYFVSKTRGRIKNGKRAGQKRPRKRWEEIEMVKFKPTGRCVTLKDKPTGGLDCLAEEIFDRNLLPPNTTPWQHFLDRFRELDPGG